MADEHCVLVLVHDTELQVRCGDFENDTLIALDQRVFRVETVHTSRSMSNSKLSAAPTGDQNGRVTASPSEIYLETPTCKLPNGGDGRG